MAGHIITLTTDFGADSPYVAQMKGVILSLNRQATVVDITHSIPPQDVRAGAIVLDEVCFRFPENTIHVAVVDPGVGTQRRIVYAKIGAQQFLAPDNGLLGAVAAKTAPERLIALTNRSHWATRVSNTFHGRDILAPVAAQLSLGLSACDLGDLISEVEPLSMPEARFSERMITGEIVAIDNFGNLITNIFEGHLSALREQRATMKIACAGKIITQVVDTYGDRPSGQVIALVGSNGRLELAVVDGSAAAALPALRGTEVSVSW